MRRRRPTRRRARPARPRSRTRRTRAGRTRRSAARATSGAASPRARPTPSDAPDDDALQAAASRLELADGQFERRRVGARATSRRASPSEPPACSARAVERAGSVGQQALDEQHAARHARAARSKSRAASASSCGRHSRTAARSIGDAAGRKPLVGGVHDVRERAAEVDAVLVGDELAARHASRGGGSRVPSSSSSARRRAAAKRAPCLPAVQGAQQLRGHASTVGRPVSAPAQDSRGQRSQDRLKMAGATSRYPPRARSADTAAARGRARASGGAARRTRADSSTRRRRPGPRPRAGSRGASGACPRSARAGAGSRTRAASGGRARRRRSTDCFSRSTRIGPTSTTGSPGRASRRSAARSRASSSPIANGFVT